jgi:hypothetical protein
MNTIVSPSAHPPTISPVHRTSVASRSLGVVARPQTYRNVAYLLLGLPLGTVWFSLLVTGVSVGTSLLTVALLGIPILLGVWYATRVFANVERVTANRLLDVRLAPAPIASGGHGNVWKRLRAMTTDRGRWRELGYLLARFPVGIATFTATAVALATPGLVAYAPFAARHEHEPFGDWALSSTMEDVATTPVWSWLLVPLGAAMLVASLHLLNVLARACGRFATAALGGDRGPDRHSGRS